MNHRLAASPVGDKDLSTDVEGNVAWCIKRNAKADADRREDSPVTCIRVDLDYTPLSEMALELIR